MLRAMARLNGDDQQARALGNKSSGPNRVKQAQRAKEARDMGLVRLAALARDELHRKMDAEAKLQGSVKPTQRAVPFVSLDLNPDLDDDHDARSISDDFE